MWHRSSEDNSPVTTDNRPIGWDDDLPNTPGGESHDGPLGGLRMAACDDQDWDVAVANGVSALKVTDWPAQPGIEPYRSITLVTDQEVPVGCDAHTSMSVSKDPNNPDPQAKNCMPVAATGGVAATSAQNAYLFEPYVRAFCELGRDP